MSVSSISSSSVLIATANALLSSENSLPPDAAAATDTPAQIESAISQLEQDEESPPSGESMAQIQADLQQFQAAQKQQDQASSSSSGQVAQPAPAPGNPGSHLNATA